mmetsp:Transcript_9890/g.26069  ORF Transcript_9890/g.26069 Transcript_9890/m.26069 type:complete len:263 (+) Transcript_9890:776-1564(+)
MHGRMARRGNNFGSRGSGCNRGKSNPHRCNMVRRTGMGRYRTSWGSRALPPSRKGGNTHPDNHQRNTLRRRHWRSNRQCNLLRNKNRDCTRYLQKPLRRPRRIRLHSTRPWQGQWRPRPPPRRRRRSKGARCNNRELWRMRRATRPVSRRKNSTRNRAGTSGPRAGPRCPQRFYQRAARSLPRPTQRPKDFSSTTNKRCSHGWPVPTTRTCTAPARHQNLRAKTRNRNSNQPPDKWKKAGRAGQRKLRRSHICIACNDRARS